MTRAWKFSNLLRARMTFLRCSAISNFLIDCIIRSDHVRWLDRLLGIVVCRRATLVWRKILVLELDWRVRLRMISSVLLVRRSVVVHSRLAERCRGCWVVCWHILAALRRLLRTSITDRRVDEEAYEGDTVHVRLVTSIAAFGCLQDEDAEANTNSACSPCDCYKIHDQDTSPKSSLEAVHCKEGSWLQGVSEEEDDREDIDEEDDDNEEHEYNHSAGDR